MPIFKSLVSVAATAGIALAISVCPIFTLKAKALTEAQVWERASVIRIFAITDDKGTVLPWALPQQPNAKPEKSQQLWKFFLGPDEAQIALKDAQKKLGPEIGKKLVVSVDSMGNVLKTISQLKDKNVILEFVPSKANLEAAKAILRAKGAATDQIPPAPVFFITLGEKEELATASIDNNQNGKIDPGESESLLFFIDKSDLQGTLDELNKLQSSDPKNTKIQVTSLFTVFENMISKDSKPNDVSEIIRFVPSRISQEYINKVIQQSSTKAPQPASTKAPQPTPTKAPQPTPTKAPQPSKVQKTTPNKVQKKPSSKVQKTNPPKPNPSTTDTPKK